MAVVPGSNLGPVLSTPRRRCCPNRHWETAKAQAPVFFLKPRARAPAGRRQAAPGRRESGCLSSEVSVYPHANGHRSNRARAVIKTDARSSAVK